MTTKCVDERVALVTGASQGTGKAAAIAFAKEGAKVVLAARNEDKLKEVADEIKADGGEAVLVITDVTKEEDCKGMVDKAFEALGGLHIAFNNHGVAGVPTGYVDFLGERAAQIFDVNLKSLVFCFKYQIPAMDMTGYKGSIIVNSSCGSLRISAGGPTHHVGVYAASKPGANMLFKYAAIEGAPSGVRVNAVAPGLTLTAMLRDLPEDLLDKMTKSHLIQHVILPEEVAKSVVFLASDAAAIVTGSVYPIDGGWSLKG